MIRALRSIRFFALAICGLSACGGADLVLPDEGLPAALAIVQGNQQAGRAGEALSQPLIAMVTNGRGRPVADVDLALVLDGGATVEPERARSAADGTATFQVVLGTAVGSVDGRVEVVPGEGEAEITAPVSFTALSADAAGIALLSGDGQAAPVSTTLPEPLVVQVADVFGNPIAGVPVTWTAEGGGAVSETSVATDADGRSQVVRTLGPTAGTQLTRASADGLAGSPVTFTATATAGSAASLQPVSGDGQSAVAGSALSNPLVVRLLDPLGNPVVGTAVTWVVGQGGGAVAPETGPTGEGGVASTQWTLGDVPGTQSVTAVVSGVGLVSFTATALPGTPPSIRLTTQPAGTARRGTPLARQPAVRLLDPAGADLAQAGVPVTVTVASGPGIVRGTLTRSTGSDGRVAFTDLVLEGPAGRYTLGFSSPGFGSAVSDPIELARASTSVRITADTPDPSLPGASVRVAYAVSSDGGRPSGTVTVRADDGATCQATVAAGACALALSRTGSNPLTVSYEGDAEFEPSTATEAHVVSVPATPTLTLTTQPSDQGTAGLPLGRQPVVQLSDGAGADVRQAGVVVTAGVASGSGTLIGTTTSTTDANGRASFTGLGLAGAAGVHTLRFTADGYLPVASEAIDVQAAATTLRIESDSPDASAPGDPVTVRFTLVSAAGTPPGDVVVTAGGLGCSASAAAGSCTLTFGQPGTFTITAAYAGGGGFAAASDDEQHTVAAVLPPGPSASASSVTVAPATVPVGTDAEVEVIVRDAAGAPLAGVDVTVTLSGSGGQVTPASERTDRDGRARFRVQSAVAEAKTITAVAGGVTLDQRPLLTVTRAPSETRIESDAPDPSEPGVAVEVRVRVLGDGATPTGQVAVTGTGGLACTITLDDGAGSCLVSPAATGEITLRADYQGDAAFSASFDEEGHTVREPAARILTLRTQPSDDAVPGEPFDRQPEIQLALEGGGDVRQAGVSVVAQVSGGALQGTTTVQTGDDGRARFTDLAIAGDEGTYTITFSADGFAPVTSAPIELGRETTETQIRDDDPDPSSPGQPVTVGVRVRGDGGTPTGTVAVSATDGSSCAAALDAAGEGTCQLTFLAEGEVTIAASYPGDGRFAPSAATADHRVESGGGDDASSP